MNSYNSGRRGSLGLPSRPQQNKDILRRQFSHETQPTVQPQNVWDERSKPLVHHILPFNLQSKVHLPNPQKTTTASQRLMPDIPIRKLVKSDSLPRSEPTFRQTGKQVEPVVGNVGRKLPQRQRSNESNWTSGVSDVSYGTLSDSTLHQEPVSQAMPVKQLPRITAQQQAILWERERTLGLAKCQTVPSIPNCGQPEPGVTDSQVYLSNQMPNQMPNQLYSSNGMQKKGGASLHVYSDQTRLHCHSGNRRRSTSESIIRNDSLSSDQSECVRPPPPKPYKARTQSGKKLRPYSSLSSSDEDVRSTPECSTEEDLEIESESISEKGEHFDRNLHKCQKIMKPEEILDAKIKKFLAVSHHLLQLKLDHLISVARHLSFLHHQLAIGSTTSKHLALI